MNEHIRASRARTQKLAWELYERMRIAEDDRDYTEIECNLINSLDIWSVLQAEQGAATPQQTTLNESQSPATDNSKEKL